MVITHDIGVVGQCALQQSLNSCVCVTLDTTVELDASVVQSRLSAAADAAADQYIGTELPENCGQGSVASSVCAADPGIYDLAILYGVDFKLLRVAEVLKNLAVFIRDCDFHNKNLQIFHFSLYGSTDNRKKQMSTEPRLRGHRFSSSFPACSVVSFAAFCGWSRR